MDARYRQCGRLLADPGGWKFLEGGGVTPSPTPTPAGLYRRAYTDGDYVVASDGSLAIFTVSGTSTQMCLRSRADDNFTVVYNTTIPDWGSTVIDDNFNPETSGQEIVVDGITYQYVYLGNDEVVLTPCPPRYVEPVPTPIPVEGSLFGYDGESDVWLCCRMSDGSVRSVGGVIGSTQGSLFVFDFTPSPLPSNVTSPEQIDFYFIDSGPDAPFPVLDVTYQVANFQVYEDFASYNIDIYVDGVRVSAERALLSGDTSPLIVSGA